MPRIKTTLVFLFLLTVVQVHAQESRFHFQRKINGPQSEGWCSLPIPADMYQWLRHDLTDIRIWQREGGDTIEVQYITSILQDVIEETSLDLPIFNKSKKGNTLFLTTELNKDQKVNRLELSFEEDNFNAFVRLEGSADQREWFKVDSLHRILSIHTGEIDFHATTLNFPLSSYRYLRIGIDADKPLTISSVSFKKHEVKEGIRNSPATRWTSSTDKKAKQTVLDVEFTDLQPVSRIEVEEEHSMDFYRPITIETLRDSAKTPKGWTYYYDMLYSGYITSLDGPHFDFPYAFTKKIRITVFNHDNPSLKFKNVMVSGPQVQLIAKMKPGENYLVYGNPSLGAPTYDMAHFTDKIPTTLEALSLEAPVNLSHPTEVSSPFFQSKYWLWGIMGLIIVVLGYFTIKMMKQNSEARS